MTEFCLFCKQLIGTDDNTEKKLYVLENHLDNIIASLPEKQLCIENLPERITAINTQLKDMLTRTKKMVSKTQTLDGRIKHVES